MAILHLHTFMTKRSTGGSAVAAVARQRGIDLDDDCLAAPMPTPCVAQAPEAPSYSLLERIVPGSTPGGFGTSSKTVKGGKTFSSPAQSCLPCPRS